MFRVAGSPAWKKVQPGFNLIRRRGIRAERVRDESVNFTPEALGYFVFDGVVSLQTGFIMPAQLCGQSGYFGGVAGLRAVRPSLCCHGENSQ